MTTKQITIAAKMLELRDTMKARHGQDWKHRSHPYRVLIQDAMDRTNNNNPLSAVIPMAKDMSAQGHNPTMLMAVAVDMSEDDNRQNAPGERPGATTQKDTNAN